MEILTKEELNLKKKKIFQRIKTGDVFISPTDTIYGLTCNATNENSVAEIRKIKNRPNSPLSIIVPSINWIRENCFVDKKVETWLNKLPGPYTLILKLNNKSSIAKNVAPENDSIGIRFPNHWFTKSLQELNFPLITTSVNKTGEQFMTSLENLDEEIKKRVKFIIYENKKEVSPSKLINVEKEEIKER